MVTLSIASARAMRDAGIDAMAALNTGLIKALVDLPAEDLAELTLTFGEVMGEVILKIINPAIQSFPELAVDESTWVAIARAQAADRVNCDGKMN